MPTMTDELIAEITGIVADELSIPASSLSADDDLRALEGADSVKMLRVIARIERIHDVELEDEDVFGTSTIREVAGLVHAGLTGAEAA